MRLIQKGAKRNYMNIMNVDGSSAPRTHGDLVGDKNDDLTKATIISLIDFKGSCS